VAFGRTSAGHVPQECYVPQSPICRLVRKVRELPSIPHVAAIGNAQLKSSPTPHFTLEPCRMEYRRHGRETIRSCWWAKPTGTLVRFSGPTSVGEDEKMQERHGAETQVTPMSYLIPTPPSLGCDRVFQKGRRM
jgi:hypothetical protein